MNVDAVAAHLASLPDDEFRRIVDRDLRRRPNQPADVEGQALRTPALIDRWYRALLAMSASVEGQLAASREDFEAAKAGLQRTILRLETKEADGTLAADERSQLATARDEVLAQQERYSRARSATVRFKSGLETWLSEARSLRRSLDESLADRVAELEDAIRRHRSEFDHDDDPTAADEKLWSLVPDDKGSLS